MNEFEIRPSAAEGTRAEHTLIAAERRDITVRGVREVLSFDEANVRLVTTAGILNLEGRGLRIHVLNTRDGTVDVTGTLDGVLYEDSADLSASDDDGAGRVRVGKTRRFFR